MNYKTVGVKAEIWGQIETELSTNSLSNLAVTRNPPLGPHGGSSTSLNIKWPYVEHLEALIMH